MAEDKKSKQLKRFSPSKRNTNIKKIDEYLNKRRVDTKLPSQVYTPIDTMGKPDYKDTTTRRNVKLSRTVKENEDMSNRATTYTNKYFNFVNIVLIRRYRLKNYKILSTNVHQSPIVLLFSGDVLLAT